MQMTATPAGRAEIGVVGGSGFYEFFDDPDGVTTVTVETPYGDPSEPVALGNVGGRPVAFLPRHGRDHRFPPHRVPYRANMWALRSLGVSQVIAPSAVGSLRPELPPGTLVVPDQLVDRTSGRAQTFYDAGAVHVSFADPYCPNGRQTSLSAAAQQGWEPVNGGTLVVVEGPRFSTRAESLWYAAQGWSVIGMTGHPEAVLARELAMCFTTLTLVTDLDAGVATGDGVKQAEVFAEFARSVERLRRLIAAVVAALPDSASRGCACPGALDGIEAAAVDRSGAEGT